MTAGPFIYENNIEIKNTAAFRIWKTTHDREQLKPVNPALYDYYISHREKGKEKMTNQNENPENETRKKRAAENVEQFFDFRDKIQKETYKPIKTGLDFYDELMDGGAQTQTLTVLIAEQGAGKSMLLQQLAESIAAQHGRRVIYLNFEMSREQLLARAISARIYKRGNMKKTQKEILRGYNWTDKERAEILEALDEYEREALPYISYNPKGIDANIEDLEEYLNELGERSGTAAPVLFVDYLQLIQNRRGEKSQEIKDRLTQVLIDLKQYAIKNNTFVYLISAINRQSSTAQKVTAASARDTSAIEYQADYLISLQNYKDQAAANNKGLQRMTLKLLKTRDGQSGVYSTVYRNGKYNFFKGEYKGAYIELGENADPEKMPEMYQALEALAGVYEDE